MDPAMSLPSSGRLAPVAIVGGGVTGLTAAFRLRQRGIPSVVYESGSRPGGPVHTTERDGYLAEDGPNTLLETSPKLRQLIDDVGLKDQCLTSDPAANKRYIVRGGRLLAVPDSLPGWMTTPLFSFGAKLNVLGELLRPRGRADVEETVAGFVRRRLGQEFLDYAINPFVGGVYAGNPERLSLREAFPKLHQVETRYRSLFLGQMLGARERRRSGETPKDRAPKLSFRHGLGSLVTALATQLGDALQLNAPVEAIRRHAGGWQVTVNRQGRHETAEHSAVLLAAPAYRLAGIQLDAGNDASLSWLGDIHYAAVTVLVLGFRREDVAHPLDGFGALIPEVEKQAILGAIFSSSLFPGRAPAGHVTLTCYLGGSRSPEMALASEEVQLAATREALGRLLGVRGEPSFLHRTVHRLAIPQYLLGFGDFRARMTKLERQAPGLRLAGHFRNGIALTDCLMAALQVAEEIADTAVAKPH
jgi:oxygen-dependent protoporphyrinogen oxidase